MAIAVAGLVLAVASGAATAMLVPDGPRLALLRVNHDSGLELGTVGFEGRTYQRLLVGGRSHNPDLADLGGLAWSPDGEEIAFSRRGRGGRAIWIVAAEGGAPRVVPGTRGGFGPVFSPDGRTLAFTRVMRKDPRRFAWGTRWDFESASVWIVDLRTGVSDQLTRWRHRLDHHASSFSPDGATLLVTRWDIERSQDLELVALRFDGRPSGLLVGEGAFPVYSPDGSQIALFRRHERHSKLEGPPEFASRRVKSNFELYVIDSAGMRLRRLTHTPHKDELFASWDPSGERIAYAQFKRGSLESPNAIMQVNADGSCESRLMARPRTTIYAPVWQPGPGREAGRIVC